MSIRLSFNNLYNKYVLARTQQSKSTTLEGSALHRQLTPLWVSVLSWGGADLYTGYPVCAECETEGSQETRCASAGVQEHHHDLLNGYIRSNTPGIRLSNSDIKLQRLHLLVKPGPSLMVNFLYHSPSIYDTWKHNYVRKYQIHTDAIKIKHTIIYLQLVV